MAASRIPEVWIFRDNITPVDEARWYRRLGVRSTRAGARWVMALEASDITWREALRDRVAWDTTWQIHLQSGDRTVLILTIARSFIRLKPEDGFDPGVWSCPCL